MTSNVTNINYVPSLLTQTAYTEFISPKLQLSALQCRLLEAGLWQLLLPISSSGNRRLLSQKGYLALCEAQIGLHHPQSVEYSVVRSVNRMLAATEQSRKINIWTIDRLLAFHRKTMSPGYLQGVRIGRAWVGGNDRDTAQYVAPPAALLDDYLQDLCNYTRQSDAVWTKAFYLLQQVIHIHPFQDGNGRFSRCWIAALLRNPADQALWFVLWHVWLGQRRRYTEAMARWRDGDISGYAQWCSDGVQQAVLILRSIADQLQPLYKRYTDGQSRSALYRQALLLVFRFPLISPGVFARLAGGNKGKALRILGMLADAGVVQEHQNYYQAEEMIAIYDSYHKQAPL